MRAQVHLDPVIKTAVPFESSSRRIQSGLLDVKEMNTSFFSDKARKKQAVMPVAGGRIHHGVTRSDDTRNPFMRTR